MQHCKWAREDLPARARRGSALAPLATQPASRTLPLCQSAWTRPLAASAATSKSVTPVPRLARGGPAQSANTDNRGASSSSILTSTPELSCSASHHPAAAQEVQSRTSPPLSRLIKQEHPPHFSPSQEERPFPAPGACITTESTHKGDLRFLDQLHAALFPSESDLDASAPAAASDLQAITAQAAARMEAVQALVQRTRARQPRGMLLGDEVHAAVGAVEKLHRYVTKLLAAVHLCGGPDARGALSADLRGSLSPTEGGERGFLDDTTCGLDGNTSGRPARHSLFESVSDRETSYADLEAEVRALRSEKTQLARALRQRMKDPSNRCTVEGERGGGALMSSVSFHPDLATKVVEADEQHQEGSEGIFDWPSPGSETATPPPAHEEQFGENSSEQPKENDGDGEMLCLFTIHSSPVLDHSIAAHPQSKSISAMSANSARSSTSQIKTEGLTRMERSRRSKLLSGKRWPYKLGNVIGAGAHGVVYLALMEDTGETVAAKQVLFSTDDPAWEAKVKSLQTEISVLRRIEHENVVGYLFTDRVQRNGMAGVLVFMEFVSGGSLANLIHHFGALPEKTAAIFVAQMLLGLRHLHDNGIVCRDVKNSNVLLSPFGVAKLADFATALLLEDDAAAMASSCGAEGGRAGGGGGGGSGLVGTPLFMSPEAIRSERVTWSTDIWSLGASVMEMVTGRPPWDHLGLGGNAVALLHRVAADDEPLPLPPNLTPLCTDFLAQCLRKDPAARPTCSQLLRHPWFEVHDVLMLSFDRSCAIGNLQIRPDVIENIGVQLSDSTSQRPVNQLAASMSVMSLSEPVQRKPLR